MPFKIYYSIANRKTDERFGNFLSIEAAEETFKKLLTEMDNIRHLLCIVEVILEADCSEKEIDKLLIDILTGKENEEIISIEYGNQKI